MNTPQLVEIDGDKLRYHLHPGQVAAWESEARFVAVIAGTQSGKTSYGSLWLHREIGRRGPGDYLVVTASYDLFKLKLLPEVRRFFEEQLGWGEYKAGDGVIESKPGSVGHPSRIILRSARAEGGLESATAKAAWLDECGQDEFEVGAWEAVQRRLSLAQGRALMTTTPYNLGWLKTQVYDRWVGGDRDYEVVCFRSIDNPAFPVQEYERARATLPDWKFQMFYNGRFSRPAGLIYGDYDEARHMVRAFTIPPTWARHVGVDFGGTEHTALIWLAEEPKVGRYYAFREAIGGGLSGAEHARAAKEYQEHVVAWVGGAGSEDDARTTWHQAGVPVAEPWIHEVEAGIDRTIALFRQDRLYIFETLTGLRSELGTYSRELDDAGEPTMKIKSKERYHRLDALRYIASVLPTQAPKVKEATHDAAAAREARYEREFGRFQKGGKGQEVKTGW